jgi:hypothetical protein
MPNLNLTIYGKENTKEPKTIGGIKTGKPGRPKGCKLINKVNRENSNQARFGHRKFTTSKNKFKQTPLSQGFHTEDYKRICVYAHYYDNEEFPFYIGSGTLGRAFAIDNRRTPSYFQKAKDTNLIKIKILKLDITKEESIDLEEEYIKKYGLIEEGGCLINSCKRNCGGSKIGNSRSIAVVQLSRRGEFIKEWVSANNAGVELGISPTCIIKVCKHRPKYNTAGGYKWLYKIEYENKI